MTYKEILMEESKERMTVLDVEIREFREQGRIALTHEDIQRRYGVHESQARDIIRGIKSVCGGGKLGTGRVLPAEVVYWESLISTERVKM